MRLNWHNDGCVHWDIRKRFSIGSSENRISSSDYLDIQNKYIESIKGNFEKRFSFYQDIVKRNPSYRRASLDFHMAVNDSFALGAHADKHNNIYVNLGTILAIEEASHTLFASATHLFNSQELNIWHQKEDEQIDVITNSSKPKSNFIKDYENIILQPEKTTYKQSNNLPHFLNYQFSKLISNSALQSLADDFSTLSILWIIGHEDAHRYLGHTIFDAFQNTRLQGAVFNEFEETPENDNSWLRRAAEMDADNSAIKRLIDSYFDRQLFKIIFSKLSKKYTDKVWPDYELDVPLNRWQRLFALRFFAASITMPLLVFQLGIRRFENGSSKNYPNFNTRIINALFEVIDRLYSIQTEGHDPYKVGLIEPGDIYFYFKYAIQDVREMTAILWGHCEENAKIHGLNAKIFSDYTAELLTQDFLARYGFYVGHLFGEPKDQEDYMHSMVILLHFMHAQRGTCDAVIDHFETVWRTANISSNVRQNRISENISALKNNRNWLNDHLKQHEHLFTQKIY